MAALWQRGSLSQSGKSRLSDTTVVTKTRRGKKRTVRTFAHILDSRTKWRCTTLLDYAAGHS
jgi:hypothetical protein